MNENNKDAYPRERISVIELNSVWFGIDILKSREVIPLPNITPVPNTRGFMIGVFNLRGEIFPIVDISTLLDMKAKKIHNGDMVILTEGSDAVVGILVDRIHGVVSIGKNEIKTAHGVISKKMEEFVSGVVTEKASEIYLLNIDRLFSSQILNTYY